MRWFGRLREVAGREHARRSAREVAKIVLGVLIALGLGAVASEIGWTMEVWTAKRALGPELGELVGQGDERRRVSGCVQRRLDRIAGALDAAGPGRLPPLGPIAQPPYRTWPRGVWDSTVGAQTAAHFDREELDNLSTAYSFAAGMERAHARELEVWTALHGVVGPGRAVSPEELSTLRGAVAEARFLDRLIVLNGLRLRQLAEAFNLPLDRETIREFAQPVRTYPICMPIGSAVPARYGEAPLAGMIERAIENPIRRR